MAKKTEKTNESEIYQIKITLKGTRPPIWRRLLVPGAITLDLLHDTIQDAMGWADCHLHQFTINGQYYSIPSPDDWDPMEDSRDIRLDGLGMSEKSKFLYEYDFGDSWIHEIFVEKILPPDPKMVSPVCIKGKRACPPEDVGGVWGYANLVEAIKDPEHEEYEELLEWVGDDFDPEEFDMDLVNALLKKISTSKS